MWLIVIGVDWLRAPWPGRVQWDGIAPAAHAA
jgi:hypothetical protein